MTECPELTALEAAIPEAEVRAHLTGCDACRLAREMLIARGATLAATSCTQFEDLLAARVAGGLDEEARGRLDVHLKTCVRCRLIANGMMTMTDLGAVRTATEVDIALLQEIDPDAYILGQEVARGGMGRVLEARDLRIGRHVALKELLGKTATHAARFEREARVTARLQHPGIVPIYEIGRWPDGTPFYSMRLVKGRTLRAALKESTTLDARLALVPSVIAAAEAVAYAHAHAIVHRDLTPANIMLGAYGETVVIDWGLAKDLGDQTLDVVDVGPYRNDSTSDLTAAGSVIGTAAYMPIEQATSGDIDARADVYALGAILYHLLAGVAPYQGRSGLEVLDQVREAPPPPLAVVAPGAPPDLVSIVDKAMARDREQRYVDARALATELVRFRDGRIVEAHAYSRGQLVRRWLRRHRATVLAGSAALLALIIAGCVGLVGILRERDRADTERFAAVASREHAQSTSVALLEEQGRQELLRGEPARALAYLDAAMQAGADSNALRVMLGLALQPLEALDGTFRCDAGAVRDFALDPTGQSIAVLCGALRVFSTDGAARFTVDADAHSVAYSHDGSQVIVAGRRAVIRNAKTGVEIASFAAGTKGAWRAWFTPDDRYAVVVDLENVARTIELASGKVRWEQAIAAPEATGNATRTKLSGQTLIVAELHGPLATWDVVRGKQVGAFTHPGDVARFDLTPDGSTVVTCGGDGRVRIWSATGEPRGAINAHTGFLRSCITDPTGKLLLLGDMRGAVDVWDLDQQTLLSRLSDAGVGALAAAFDNTGTRVAISRYDRISVWDARSGHEIQTVFAATQWNAIAFDATGRILAPVASHVAAWKLPAPGISMLSPSGEADVAINLDGSRLVTRNAIGRLTLWNTRTRERISIVEVIQSATQDGFFTSAISLDGRRLAVVAGDRLVVLELETGRMVATFPHPREDSGFSLDRHGARLLVGGRDPVLWDVDRAVALRTWTGKRDALAISPDGSRALVRADATRFEIFATSSPQPLSTLVTSGGEAWSSGFSADGTRVLLGEQAGMFGSVLGLWNAETGERMLRTTSESGSFDPERTMFTTSDGGRGALWRASDGTRIGVAANRAFLPNTGGELLQVGSDEDYACAIADANGRVLAHLGRSHTPVIVTPRGVLTMSAEAHWIPGTRTIVVPSGGAWSWTIPREQRTRDQIHALAQRQPWRLVDGHLVAATGTLRGRVTRAHRPVVAIEVVAVEDFGQLPHLGMTDATGAFVLSDLPPAVYKVTPTGTDAKSISVEVRADEIAETTFALP